MKLKCLFYKLSDLGIFIYLFGIIVFSNGSIIMKAVKVLFVLIASFYVMLRRKMAWNQYLGWFFVYSVYISLSALWAVHKNTSYETLQTIVLNFICIWAYIQLVGFHYNKIVNGWIALSVFPILFMLKLFLQHGTAVFRGIRNLNGIPSSVYNSLGMYAAIAICLLVIIRKLVHKNKRMWLNILMVLNLFLVIISGSRKSVLYATVPLVVYFILKSKNPFQIIKNTLLLICCVLIGFVVLMKVDFLYERVGHGLITMISGLMGAESDGSTYGRIRVINWGLEIFKERPFFGHGLENFKSLHFDVYGTFYLADNNYVQLLVDQGIMGLILYYSFHVFLLLRLWKEMARDKENLTVKMLIGMELAILVCDYGTVSYRNMFIQIMLCNICMMIPNRKSNMPLRRMYRRANYKQE